MSKRRTGDPWMPAPSYGASLRGLSLNLLVHEIDAALRFQREVLGAQVLYSDADIAVLRHNNSEWMLHADHTYDAHPLYSCLIDGSPRGIGAEIRLHDHDPDEAQARARTLGYEVVQPTSDKSHGLRECFLRDPDGYVWVVDRPLAELP